jgi:integrase/recombinase XerD
MKLQTLVEQYVAFRRALGERCITNAGILKAFGRAVGPEIAIAEVRAEQVEAFLRGSGPVTSAWHVRYAALSGLYRYALTRGYAAESPLPTSVPKRPPSLVPYIYTREELRRLLAATEATRHPLRRAEPQTLRAILLLLYGAGLRVGEARNLACEDVDLGSSIATVRDGQFFKSRLVPLAPQLVGVLAEYRAWRQAKYPSRDPKAGFFVGPGGTRLSKAGLDLAFRKARKMAGIRRSDCTSFQPRMHDLRHTFAVHRLLDWYRQGADVQKLLPHLSVYLGHRRLCHTQVYLTMIPELLEQACTRFDQYAQKEVHDG